MATKRFTARVLAGAAVVAGAAGGRAAAQPTVDAVLARKPAQPGVAVTTPAGPDLAGCRADRLAWPKPASGPAPAGVVVRDAQGRTVRQFVDTAGGGRYNIASFYRDGVEAYREIDANGDGRPDQFRWLGPNGGKWGEDKDGDGQIDHWYVLSAEELSQELLAAVVARDPRRLAPLLPKADELKAAGFPDGEAAKLVQRAAGAGKRLADTADALGLTADARWVHVEMGVPQTTPGDAVGSPIDLVYHKHATVLVDKGDMKSAEPFQTGPLVLVGRAWRVVDGPAPGHAGAADPAAGPNVLDPALLPLVQELDHIRAPDPAAPGDVVKYHTARAAVLEKVVGRTQGAAQEPWLRQVIDAYAAAAEAGDGRSADRLRQWQKSIAEAGPQSPAAAYAAFRVAAAEYAGKVSAAKPDDMPKVQDWWRDQLEGFVRKYPQADDAPEAVLRLAVACEFAGKDGEAQAKGWYDKLAAGYPAHPYAAKAAGAVRRLSCDGQPFHLAGTVLGEGKPFDLADLRGKPVVVFYWASWARGTAAELKQLGDLAKLYKGLEVVTVSLDQDPAAAAKAVADAGLTGVGTHLYAAGGLDAAPPAVAYGIQMVPHVFLVAKDGTVANRNAQTGPVLKDEVEKLMK